MINEDLYQELCISVDSTAGVGGDRVIVRNEGEQFRYHLEHTPTGKKRVAVDNYGETYCVCCPYCGDTRNRLYINHMWNENVEGVPYRMKYLVHCFNEECEKNEDFHEVLTSKLNPLSIRTNRKRGVLKVGPTPVTEEDLSVVVVPPGEITPLANLDSSHPAITFLESRGHNVKKLSTYFKVGYCEHSKYSMASNRIIVPFYYQDELQGWQARYIGDVSGLFMCGSDLCQHLFYCTGENKPLACPACNHSDHKPRYVPKWYTSPGIKTNNIFYNYHTASNFSQKYTVLVEGPLDVINLGNPTGKDLPGPGMAVLGKSLSLYQIESLLLPWRQPGRYVVVMFDGEAIDNTMGTARRLRDAGYNAVPVTLVDGEDPGSANHDKMWSLIDRCAKELYGTTLTG